MVLSGFGIRDEYSSGRAGTEGSAISTDRRREK